MDIEENVRQTMRLEVNLLLNGFWRLRGALPPLGRLLTPAGRDGLMVDLRKSHPKEQMEAAFDGALAAVFNHDALPWIALKADAILRGALVVAGMPIDNPRVRLAGHA